MELLLAGEDDNKDEDSNSENIKLKKDKAQSNWKRIFQPWKWKKKKKSDQFIKTATGTHTQKAYITLLDYSIYKSEYKHNYVNSYSCLNI